MMIAVEYSMVVSGGLLDNELIDGDWNHRIGATADGALRSQRYAAYRLLADMIGGRGLSSLPTIVRDGYGKPYFDERPELRFNVSHCRDVVAVVISNRGEVGIDVESRREVGLPVIRRVCNDKELSDVEQSEDMSIAFLRIWTRKEALLKCMGIGIRRDLRDLLSGAYRTDNDLRIESVALRSAGSVYRCGISIDGKVYQIETYDIEDGCLSVCCEL